jgi:hypothetical protein
MTQTAQPGPEQSLVARHEALIRVSRAINVHRDPKELFRVLASELQRVVNFDYVALFLYDEAANWVVMGRTTGRGKNCPNKRPNRSIKEVLGYPLTPHFRELLAEV